MQLGSSDLTVPALGVGAMTWGQPSGLSKYTPAKLAYGGPEGAEQEAGAFLASLAAGVTLFDTAAMYSNGASERRLSELAKGTSAVIATKFPPGMRATADDLPEALAASLARLRRTTIDLYQHHFPSRRVDIAALMGRMAQAVHEGQVRAVGVSNYSEEQVRLAHRVLADHGIPLASNQVQYSLLHRQPETDGVLDACRELGVTLIAYQPLASGALSGKYLAGVRPRGLRRLMANFRSSGRQAVAPVVALLNEIGVDHEQPPTAVALRWLVQQESVLPIPGAKSADQARANARTLDFELSGDEVETLELATRGWRG